MQTRPWFALPFILSPACSDVKGHDHDHDHDHAHDHNHGLTTRLELHFTPEDGGDPLTFVWADPENDGSPEIDEIVLPDAAMEEAHTARRYTLDVEVWNDLESPAEDVTPEIAEGDAEHQFFFTGSAVQGPATGDNPDALVAHAYADTDRNGLPVGLVNTIETLARGTGEITVTLRHMPPESGQAVKQAGLAQTVADEGFGAIGGDNDIQVTLPLTVD